MYYTYMLQSRKDMMFYIGLTKDLKLRFEEHNNGLVESSKDRRRLKLIYCEACIDKDDATKREKTQKHITAKRF